MTTTPDPVEIFADMLCPFAHVGIHRVLEARLDRGGSSPKLWIRAWPLETINDGPFDGDLLADEIAALRGGVAPELFAGFDPKTFPSTAMPAFALAAAGHRVGPAVGEAVSIELRNRLWEHGEDIADPGVLAEVADVHGIEVTDADRATVAADHAEGEARGVIGSPYFFANGEGFFCPTFNVSRDGSGFHVTPDRERFATFVAAALG
ncbi:MAG: DsbA family protein [Actinobacteria bacterium]|nr:DsbA family protein [Actinomycetota bacterium]